MAGNAGPNERRPIIVVRRGESAEAGHHGGAWKVAYADFVTALMAFFLLMWLLNATTEEQRKGLADYFSPTNLFGHTLSGSGQPFGGHTPNDAGSMISDRGALQVIPGPQAVQLDVQEDDSDTPAQPQQRRDGGPSPDPSRARRDHPGNRPAAQTDGPAHEARPPQPDAASLAAAAASAAARADALREERALRGAALQLREAVQQDPALRDIARQLVIEQAPEGLRLQLLDAERGAMFALGNATPNERVRLLVQKMAPILAGLPNQVAISGHTDAAPFPGADKTNWELSTDRANATRRLLVEAGIPEARIRSVTGNADRDLLLPNDPLAAGNRRVAIVVLRNAPPSPPPAPLAPPQAPPAASPAGAEGAAP